MQSKVAQIVTGKTGAIYTSLLEGLSTYPAPHEFVSQVYSAYKEKHTSNPSMNGRIFELLICETLLRRGIAPFYYQVQITLVPNADFDIVCFNPLTPVVLSCKVSLRERYKQAVLEAMVLQQVYRQAKSYLVTMSPQEAKILQGKIQRNEIEGLTACIRADSEEYTELLDKLATYDFVEAEPMMPLHGTFFPVSSI